MFWIQSGLKTFLWYMFKFAVTWKHVYSIFTVAGNTQNSASMTISPMPRMPRNRLLWRQWKWLWCCTNRLVPWKWWTGWIEWIWWTNSSPPVMWTPACGAWVNWAGTCPRPQPSKLTPSAGKDYIKHLSNLTHQWFAMGCIMILQIHVMYFFSFRYLFHDFIFFLYVIFFFFFLMLFEFILPCLYVLAIASYYTLDNYLKCYPYWFFSVPSRWQCTVCTTTPWTVQSLRKPW